MKSKTFSDKNRSGMVKGQLWIPVLLGIVFLLIFPVAELMQLGSWAGMGYLQDNMMRLYKELWKHTFVQLGIAGAFGAALLNGVHSFWYLYSASKVDFYHCLPINRREMFIEKTLTGVKYYLIPYAIMEFLAVCIGAARGYFSLEFMALALVMLAVHLIMYLMTYFAVVLAICLTGNLLMGVPVLAGIFLYGPIAIVMVRGYFQTFFRTYAEADGIWNRMIEFCSPLAICMSFADVYYSAGKRWQYGLVMIAAAALLGMAAYYAYVKRPMEAAGKSVVYKFVEVILEFMVVIAAGLGVGLIFYIIPMGESKVYWWVFGLALGTVLVHGMLQVIFYLDFRKFFFHKIQFALAAVCVAVCAMTFKMDLFGYDSFMPAYESLDGIASSLKNNGESGLEIERLDNGNYRFGADWGMIGRNLGISPEIYETLKKIAAKQKTGEIKDFSKEIFVRYDEKSGKETYRNYKIFHEDVKELMKAFYDTGFLKENTYSFLQIEDQYLREITGSFCDNLNYVLFQEERKKLGELAEALREDMEEADSEMMMQVPCALLEFSYEDIPIETNDGAVKQRYFATAYVYPGFKRTVAILEETGYPLSVEELDMEYAEYTVYNTDNGQWNEISEGKITDREQLEELKTAIIPYGLMPDWMAYEDSVYLEVKTVNGRGASSMRVQKDQFPEFLKQKMETAGIFDTSNLVYADAGVQIDYN